MLSGRRHCLFVWVRVRCGQNGQVLDNGPLIACMWQYTPYCTRFIVKPKSQRYCYVDVTYIFSSKLNYEYITTQENIKLFFGLYTHFEWWRNMKVQWTADNLIPAFHTSLKVGAYLHHTWCQLGHEQNQPYLYGSASTYLLGVVIAMCGATPRDIFHSSCLIYFLIWSVYIRSVLSTLAFVLIVAKVCKWKVLIVAALSLCVCCFTISIIQQSEVISKVGFSGCHRGETACLGLLVIL